MPSSKDPLSSINPGPGKLPAGVASASSLLFSGGSGGGGADLLAHINDPVDAHMASAIGVNPTNPVTGLPLLASAGGVIDGESVLDFIAQAKDLFPDRPNRLGAAAAIPNTGIPDWDTLANASLTRGGAWTDGTAAVFSHFIMGSGVSMPLAYEAITYPADRGVLAVYRSTDGDYANPGTMTLYAALWLGPTANQPGALTCPSADFQEALRESLQADYVATNAGLDQISLSDRIGYLKDFTPSGTGYDNYTATFYAYQLARHNITFPAAVDGSNDSWLVIHWKESYALTDASIAPAAIAGNFTANNCYSAVPGTFNAVPVDSAGIQSLNRRYLFRDALSGAVPTVASWTATLLGIPPTVSLSGVRHYSDANTLSWDVDLRVDGLVGNAWLPGTVGGAQLPADFVTANDPIEYDFFGFGGAVGGRPYYTLRQTGAGSPYTAANAPQPGHQVQDLLPTLAVSGPYTPHTPPSGAASLVVNLNRPFVQDQVPQANLYMFNSWPQSGSTASTETFEPFVDENYRFDTSYVFTPTTPILPVGAGVKFDSLVPLIPAAPGGDLQVVGDRLVYPKDNFSLVFPASNPDYAALFAADPGNAYRLYVRVFNTGIARNTGRLRVRGINFSDMEATPEFTGDFATDHPGGVFISLMVPGATEGLDLGRPKGSPDLNVTLALRGCLVSYEVDGLDLILTYDTTFYTADNGAFDFPLVLSVAFLKTGGSNRKISEIEWLPPLLRLGFYRPP